MTGFDVLAPGSTGLMPADDDLDEARLQIRTAALVGIAQQRTRADVLAFCDAHPDALHRSCVEGHLTGSAVVVDPATSQTLLIHHAKLDRWLQPGGHADGDGNLAAVAWREATEETGLEGLQVVVPAIDIDVHGIPARPGEPEHAHLDLRHLVLVGPDRAAVGNHETLGARWLTPGDPAVSAGSELSRLVTRAVEVAAVVTGAAPGRRRRP
ncbi:MAG: NUDIX hydrolase [Acidimicrobiia bacterium]|nr:NUDIX hydrolase [Acidimicrobiia bacterium]